MMTNGDNFNSNIFSIQILVGDLNLQVGLLHPPREKLFYHPLQRRKGCQPNLTTQSLTEWLEKEFTSKLLDIILNNLNSTGRLHEQYTILYMNLSVQFLSAIVKMFKIGSGRLTQMISSRRVICIF